MSWRVMVASPQGKAKVLVRGHQKEARWRRTAAEAAEAESGGEDGVVDAEAAPEVGVDGAELGYPEVPVAGRAEPSAEGEAALGGGGSLDRGRRAEGVRRGRAAACVLRRENVSQGAPVIPIDGEGELMD
jgi:hypothetical protein